MSGSLCGTGTLICNHLCMIITLKPQFSTLSYVSYSGLLSTFTLFEFMVWISKVYRTTAVLFMVVGTFALVHAPILFRSSNECFFFPPRPPFTDVQPCVQVFRSHVVLDPCVHDASVLNLAWS